MIKFIKNIIQAVQYSKQVKQAIKNSPHVDTLFNGEWMIENHDSILNMLPDMWTHVDNLDYPQLGIELTILGVYWKTREDIIDILNFLLTIEMLIVKNGFQIIRNPNNPIAENIQKYNAKIRKLDNN